ncbi:DUF2537 domain-containing protein [Nocardia cyriacigeorgica]|uniref:DUF2537 domain-containing protein n=1 Tax=Nocardia cyriacigeorgica (strain GUH-2) TaxID=1127134 RepID=H6QY24_NOCCG|nr:DUF2537 domain-containing protein [Nocardia cyriacigeorgica]MBF6083836.1 DUF2537 domain-containing protein [Nocardia cyriacigeorgica]MBF6286052.1 DUF2537 domain-containing protein [Nocardia cyriacigeorgica]MBF6425894.1 DUF2537 domain-containing protein [Nocardia cyriacigeorgica]CCF61472.1 conserved membrane protein of unknown function [Nocardia cyriacigeorgica GUH-2]BDT84892.1 membrane protein [Nocardia cyriacigeorgica]
MSDLSNNRYDPYHDCQDPTPWAAGITVTVLVAALTTVAVYAFGAALAEVHPLLAVGVNVVAVGGVAPTAWRWRSAPVTRWVLAGGAIGVLLAWIGLLLGV